jgi:hypothetical protein
MATSAEMILLGRKQFVDPRIGDAKDWQTILQKLKEIPSEDLLFIKFGGNNYSDKVGDEGRSGPCTQPGCVAVDAESGQEITGRKKDHLDGSWKSKYNTSPRHFIHIAPEASEQHMLTKKQDLYESGIWPFLTVENCDKEVDKSLFFSLCFPIANMNIYDTIFPFSYFEELNTPDTIYGQILNEIKKRNGPLFLMNAINKHASDLIKHIQSYRDTKGRDTILLGYFEGSRSTKIIPKRFMVNGNNKRPTNEQITITIKNMIKSQTFTIQCSLQNTLFFVQEQILDKTGIESDTYTLLDPKGKPFDIEDGKRLEAYDIKDKSILFLKPSRFGGKRKHKSRRRLTNKKYKKTRKHT